MNNEQYPQDDYNQPQYDPMMINNQLGYQNVDPFMADEVNYTHRIINDEVRADLEKRLEEAFLKRRTLEKIKTYLIAGTTFELVINNFPTKKEEDKEKLGFRYARLWIDANISAVENKYNDSSFLLKIIEIHHRTKLPRSAKGFERGKQKETITSSRISQMQPERTQEPKTGISRITKGWSLR